MTTRLRTALMFVADRSGCLEVTLVVVGAAENSGGLAQYVGGDGSVLGVAVEVGQDIEGGERDFDGTGSAVSAQPSSIVRVSFLGVVEQQQRCRPLPCG
jgi:hypothetical protein